MSQPGLGYGYQWWTRDDGTFNASGIHGQHIHIDPARRLVIAINSARPVAEFTRDRARHARHSSTRYAQRLIRSLAATPANSGRLN
jgi:CubicO group peptidase (beta-lactamase class C family)